MLSDLPARFRAIAAIQQRRSRYAMGSWSFDTLDHAIDLALEPRRVVDSYLVRNVLRDSRRVRIRGRSRQREVLAADTVAVTDTDEDIAEFDNSAVEYSTPDAELLMLDTATYAVRDIDDDRGERLLAALVEGRTIREIARLLSISPSHAAVLARNLKRAVASRSQSCE